MGVEKYLVFSTLVRSSKQEAFDVVAEVVNRSKLFPHVKHVQLITKTDEELTYKLTAEIDGETHSWIGVRNIVVPGEILQTKILKPWSPFTRLESEWRFDEVSSQVTLVTACFDMEIGSQDEEVIQKWIKNATKNMKKELQIYKQATEQKVKEVEMGV